MKINEVHHADVLVEFYRELTERFGEKGLRAFCKGSQLYGESRGRRMALRALRDGYELDYDSYFAYGEFDSTPGEAEYRMKAEPGLVKENAVRCLWATEFAARGCKDCGRVYCKLIDKAVARGFDPNLQLELLCNMHDDGECIFLYRDERITRDTLDAQKRLFKPGQNEKLPMEYHTAEVYLMMEHTVNAVFPEEAEGVIAVIRAHLAERHGKEFLEVLDSYRNTDFLVITK